MNLKSSAFFLFLFLELFSFGQRIQNAGYSEMLDKLLSHKANEISIADAASLNDAIFLDTREKVEFDVSHIRNAIWVGYNDFSLDQLKGIKKDDKIVLYCSVGYRSEKIAQKLMRYGFVNVWNLYGGIFEWKNQGNPVYDNSNHPTEKVHAYSEKWGQWLTSGEKVYQPKP